MMSFLQDLSWPVGQSVAGRAPFEIIAFRIVAGCFLHLQMQLVAHIQMGPGKALVKGNSQIGLWGGVKKPSSTRRVWPISGKWNSPPVPMHSIIKRLGAVATRWIFAAHATGPA